MSRDTEILSNAIKKCEALKKAGLWLREPKIRPRAWLENFDEADKSTAALILDRFTFFTDDTTDKLLGAAFGSFIQHLKPSSFDLTAAWKAYYSTLNTVFITKTEKEDPNPSESGNLFCRKARQVLRLQQDQILEPAVAIAEASHGNPVIFVDDFIGSGEQFIKTWKRRYRPTYPSSFEEAFNQSGFKAYYICPIATIYGALRIGIHASNVQIFSAHVLDNKYSLHPSNELVQNDPDGTYAKIDALIKKYSPRLKLESFMTVGTHSLYGFHNLALTIAFAHSVPDATIPLLWAPGGSNWTPLIERL